MNSNVENMLCDNLSPEAANWFLKSLKELSFDQSAQQQLSNTNFWDNSHPTLSKCRAINFDDIAKLYCNHKNLTRYRCRSCDALYIVRNSLDDTPEIYWIEFKNGVIERETIREITDKIKDGNMILEDADSLNNGVLDFSLSEPRLIEGEPAFGFGKRLSSIGIPTKTVSYIQEHSHFILVYNEEKKDKLLPEDLDAICDEIDCGGYQALVDNVEATRELHVIWTSMCNENSINENTSAKALLIKIIKKSTAGSEKFSWFKEINNFFELCGKMSRGYFSEEISSWDSLSCSDVLILIEKIDKKILQLPNGAKKNGFNRMKKLLKDCVQNENYSSVFSFEQAVLSMINLATDVIYFIIDFLQKKQYKKKFEQGAYNLLLQKIEEMPAIIPLSYEGNAQEYVYKTIEDGTFSALLRECGDENVYDATAFLDIASRCTIWPTSFFRFAQYNGFLYKDCCTYSRPEFKEKFIDTICRESGDTNCTCYDA